MKKSIFKTALMSAAALSGIGLFASPASASVKSSATQAEQVRGVLKVVDHQKGEIHLYDRDGNVMKQTVKNGQDYKVWEKAMINGELMYRIGTNKQWIPAKYTNWDNAKVGQNVAINIPTSNAISNRQNYAGSVRVNYQGQGKVRLVNDQGQYVSQYAAKNSTWRVWEKANINNEPMYRIGTQSQWTPAKYVAPAAAKPVQNTAVVNTPVVKPAAPVVNNQAVNTGNQTNNQVPAAKPSSNTSSQSTHTTNTNNSSTSNHTTAPVKPSTPVAPSKPSQPTTPSKPTEPTKPAEPAKPVTPVTPAKPSTPSTPATPSKPSQPTTPAKPSETKPAQPVTPTKPVTPAEPTKPSTPTQNQTGVNALSTTEAAAIVQNRLLKNGYVQGDMAGFKANEYSGNAIVNTMDLEIRSWNTTDRTVNHLNNAIIKYGWDEAPDQFMGAQYNHTFTTAEYQNVKADNSGTLHLTKYVY